MPERSERNGYKYDSKCAENAGIDFALAVWGSHNKHIKADYFLERPADLLAAITSEKKASPDRLNFDDFSDNLCEENQTK